MQADGLQGWPDARLDSRIVNFAMDVLGPHDLREISSTDDLGVVILQTERAN